MAKQRVIVNIKKSTSVVLTDSCGKKPGGRRYEYVLLYFSIGDSGSLYRCTSKEPFLKLFQFETFLVPDKITSLSLQFLPLTVLGYEILRHHIL